MSERRPEPSGGPRVIVLSGSTRRGSLNEQLARLAAHGMRELGADAEYVDLREYPMVLFDPDLEAAEGPPPEAHRLCELLLPARGLMIASPEYNAAMTPLLKNVVDWVTRVEFAAFGGKRVALMSASPGRTGGRNGLAVVALWLSNILMEVYEERFSVPRAREVLVDGGLAEEQAAAFREFLEGFARTLD